MLHVLQRWAEKTLTSSCRASSKKPSIGTHSTLVPVKTALLLEGACVQLGDLMGPYVDHMSLSLLATSKLTAKFVSVPKSSSDFSYFLSFISYILTHVGHSVVFYAFITCALKM